jgi:ligand-binding SRPBCC domain-containing protein
MKVFKLVRQQDLAVNNEACWDFFSNPQNLKKITPDYMGFDIVEGGESEMYAGQIIAYKVSPLLNLKVTWVTEITHVRERRFFVDEQRFGPYKFWHHKHFFEAIKGGTRCRDEIHYLPPLSLFAGLMDRVIIRRKLNEIFDYRAEILEAKFGVVK